MPNAPSLRPLTVMEIVDASFRLYRRNFGLFLGILAAILAPFAILFMLFYGYFMSLMTHAMLKGPDGEFPFVEFFTVMGVGFVGFLIQQFIAKPLAMGALTRAVGDVYLNQPASIGRAYRAVLNNFWPYLGAILLSGLVTTLGLFCCLVPGILFGVWFSMTAPVCVLEGRGGTAAMGRSRELVRGHGWRVVGLFLLSFLVTVALTIGISILSAFVIPLMTENQVTQAVVQQGISALIELGIAPLWSVSWVLLYYDLRIRKEGFDMEILARTMGSPAGFFPPPKAAP